MWRLGKLTYHNCKGYQERTRPRFAVRHVEATRNSQGGPIKFTATYPANFLREKNGKGFHVRFPALPEALTGGVNLDDTREEASDCLAEALAGRIARGDLIPAPSWLRRAQYLVHVPLYLAPT